MASWICFSEVFIFSKWLKQHYFIDRILPTERHGKKDAQLVYQEVDDLKLQHQLLHSSYLFAAPLRIYNFERQTRKICPQLNKAKTPMQSSE